MAHPHEIPPFAPPTLFSRMRQVIDVAQRNQPLMAAASGHVQTLATRAYVAAVDEMLAILVELERAGTLDGIAAHLDREAQARLALAVVQPTDFAVPA